MRAASSRVWFVILFALCVTGSPRTASSQEKALAQTRRAPPLTPEEREAQKHYRIAQEALKNNDLATAEDELKTASTLAPNNALILYNLAVVESKSDHPDSALEHLDKAMRLGLPASQQDNADQLEAKLIYQLKQITFDEKVKKLIRLVEDGSEYKQQCRNDAVSSDMKGASYLSIDGNRVHIRMINTENTQISTGNNSAFMSVDDRNYEANLSELDPSTMTIEERDRCSGKNPPLPSYVLTTRSRNGEKSIRYVNGPLSQFTTWYRRGDKSEADVRGTGGPSNEAQIEFAKRQSAEEAVQLLKEIMGTTRAGNNTQTVPREHFPSTTDLCQNGVYRESGNDRTWNLTFTSEGVTGTSSDNHCTIKLGPGVSHWKGQLQCLSAVWSVTMTPLETCQRITSDVAWFQLQH